MAMPVQKPGRSKQDYATPWSFIKAACGLLGIFGFTHDFAADDQNHKADSYWTIRHNSLARSAAQWATASAASVGGWGWLNLPFSRIAPWARKCAETREAGGQVAFLVPAAVGSNWFRDWVHDHAYVWALNGRIAFDPEHPTWGYPKDAMLCLFSPLIEPGFGVWTWAS